MEFKKSSFIFLLSFGLLSACGGGSSGNNSNTQNTISSSSSSSSSVVSSASLQSSSSSSVHAITKCEIENFKNDDTISYRLPILYGRCPTSETSLNLEVAGKSYIWPVKDGYFKGAVLLDRGTNEIRLSTDEEVSYLIINVAPSQSIKKVQMVYAIAANDDGHFLASPDEANDIESARKRLVIEALMLQSATARMIFKSTGKHQTFALIEDENGLPLIQIFQMSQTRELLYPMDGYSIYYSIQEQLQTEQQYDNKYMVTMGFSDYVNGKTVAHAALGGSNLGIFGGLHLHTCPETLDEISESFSNANLIDTNTLPDDSAGRGNYWANCATGMGASLHELGHAFGLPHTNYGIMNRGFDHFNRLFMITEPGYSGTITASLEYDAVWHPNSLKILASSPWIEK